MVTASSRPNVKVGISIGDVNGISPEVIMKALGDSRMLVDCTPVIYGSSKVFSFHKKQMDSKESKNGFNYTVCATADEADNEVLAIRERAVVESSCKRPFGTFLG